MTTSRFVIAVVVLTGVLCCGPLTGCRSADPAAPVRAAVAASDPAAAPEPPVPPPPRSFTLVAVGDVMLDRAVWRRIEANGSGSIFERVRDDLRAADICFCNLECPLSTVGPHSPREHLLFRADPAAVEVLVDGGVDVVSLANNHTLNAGEAGLMQTLDHLEEVGVAYCGAHRERDRSWEPCLFEVEGLSVGFVACTDLSFEHGSRCRVDTELTKFADHIEAAGERCEVLVVSIHWGNEYQKTPTERQQEVARAAVEAGADLIVGHHPHTLQGVGQYQGVPILYSCGNFVFDQREGERMESAIFHLRFVEDEGWHVRMVPVWIPRTRCGPIYPGAARSKRITHRLAGLSGNMGTVVDVEDTEGRAFIRLAEETRASEPAEDHDDRPLTTVAAD